MTKIPEDIDIKPVPVDKLVQFTDLKLQQRVDRAAQLVALFENIVVEAEDHLQAQQRTLKFLQGAHTDAVLAQQLKLGDVVRVFCPVCKGSGLRPDSATSGRLQRQSAFEMHDKPIEAVEPDPKSRCTECQGQKWVLMDRYKG